MIDEAPLAREAFFAGMPRAALDRLASTARQVEFPDGQRIFDEGGPADRFWILQAGMVALDLHVPGRGSVIIETFGPGAVLGWSWLHAPYRWRFGAVARAPVRALEFDGPLVRALCAIDPAMAYELSSRFSEIIVDRLQATRMRLLDLYTHPAERG
ncbi:Crp/Fnr family transcriptional regulator [Actinomadura rugatobispora]|uniref:Crp/Fnr family transcriptional regulator n=1 Tax=Actinomadura rugatobispora TaxID=1994 RepID=A0ABW0ZYA4_9ACTN|nr:cyclic nucleotide-binding domain-containing protein [Actinomadura rugatobispora]